MLLDTPHYRQATNPVNNTTARCRATLSDTRPVYTFGPQRPHFACPRDFERSWLSSRSNYASAAKMPDKRRLQSQWCRSGCPCRTRLRPQPSMAVQPAIEGPRHRGDPAIRPHPACRLRWRLARRPPSVGDVASNFTTGASPLNARAFLSPRRRSQPRRAPRRPHSQRLSPVGITLQIHRWLKRENWYCLLRNQPHPGNFRNSRPPCRLRLRPYLQIFNILQ